MLGRPTSSPWGGGLLLLLALFWGNPAVANEDCGQFPDVITAPSHKSGSRSCDSDRDGSLKDSKYCRCDDCDIHPESCHRKGDEDFCGCDPTLQHCLERSCVGAGTCDADLFSSYMWSLDCNDYNVNRFPGNCETCGDLVDDNCNGSTTDCDSQTDGDGDGYFAPEDCLDNNPNAYPGAPEIPCNAVDEDCSGEDLCEESASDPDGDGFSAPADCDEGDAAVYPGAPDACGDNINSDCDPLGLDCPDDIDGDGFTATEDCDDTDATIYPGANDFCGDAIDQDCDGMDRPCLLDQDRDGYDAVSVGGLDCNDFHSQIYPGALEVCDDGHDQDCSGEDVTCEDFDTDGDGFGDSLFGGMDCDDTDDSVFPGAPEFCGDNLDSNCDGLPDIPCPTTRDSDGDGFYSSVIGGADCNDHDSRIFPYALEVCGDGTDNDCNGLADDGCSAPNSGAHDNQRFVNSPSNCSCAVSSDHIPQLSRGMALLLMGICLLLSRRSKNYGNSLGFFVGCCLSLGASMEARADPPSICFEYADRDSDGYVYGQSGVVCPRDDCDDDDDTIHPGATDTCGDGIDQDCDGQDSPCINPDEDADGFLNLAAGGHDCDDNDPATHPGAPEICGDGQDNDCQNGDEECLPDEDGDGYPSMMSGGTDCDDNDDTVHPYALEICGDGIDNDCAGGDFPCAPDIDGDGALNPHFDGDDCDDFDAATHPGAEEICGDNRDQNCDGVDEACEELPTDVDGDGHDNLFYDGDDCNDLNPEIHPDAAEICGDGLDQNCDGLEFSCTAATGDADGDGFKGIQAGGEDCNDGNAAIYPGALEVCGDGTDQDCDGRDARVGQDLFCDGTPATNPSFDHIRNQSALLHDTDQEISPSHCQALAKSDGGIFILLSFWFAFGSRKRRCL